jgi:hypothetical protein
MSKETERAKQLAVAHWDGYVGPLADAHGAKDRLYTHDEMLALCAFHYKTSHIHGYKHGCEDTRHGFSPVQTEARYAEIHTPLPAEDVAAISEGVGTERVVVNLCPTCGFTQCAFAFGRDNFASECAKYESKTPPPSLCATCAKADKSCPIWRPGLHSLGCVEYAPKGARRVKGFVLPSIMLDCTAEEAWAKYEEECKEVQSADTVLHSLIELWDCAQAVQTCVEKGGNKFDVYEGLLSDMDERRLQGNQVDLALRAMLCKNAARWRYSDAVNRIILESNGHSWQ